MSFVITVKRSQRLSPRKYRKGVTFDLRLSKKGGAAITVKANFYLS
jgi:hypothetical protein